MENNKKLTIFVSTCVETGHLEACTGQALALKKRGHRVIFILADIFKGNLAKLGFEEFNYALSDEKAESGPSPSNVSKSEEVETKELKILNLSLRIRKLQTTHSKATKNKPNFLSTKS